MWVRHPAFGVFFDQNDPTFSTTNLKFAVIFKQVWALFLCVFASMFFKDKTEQSKKWTSNHSFRSNKKRLTRSLRASSWAMCTFHPSSFYTLRLQRKLVNIAKTGKPTSNPHLPKYPLLFEGKKKPTQTTSSQSQDRNTGCGGSGREKHLRLAVWQ